MDHDNTKELNAMDEYTRDVLYKIFNPSDNELMDIRRRDEIIEKIHKNSN